jgi:glyoxylase-like metal-dependent hydrolase (beta-lactamase superfamily II)
MILKAINPGFFKLDGGAMHGVVPKSIWNRFNPADEHNLCQWALRCLYVEVGEKRLLIDSGMGKKQPESFLKHYQCSGEHDIRKSLDLSQIHPESITDVFLTHLHFDHVGGATMLNAQGESVLSFPNAHHWVSAAQWQWAMQPNDREKASFLKENLLPLQNSGKLSLLKNTDSPFAFMSILQMGGHTEGQLLPLIDLPNGRTLAYCADLIPSCGHLPIPYVMAYDVKPLQSMEEKASFLERALHENWILFFEHDPLIECAELEQTDKGIRASRTGTLAEALLW